MAMTPNDEGLGAAESAKTGRGVCQRERERERECVCVCVERVWCLFIRFVWLFIFAFCLFIHFCCLFFVVVIDLFMYAGAAEVVAADVYAVL